MMAKLSLEQFANFFGKTHQATEVPDAFDSSSRMIKLLRRAALGFTAMAVAWVAPELRADQPFHPFAESMDIDPDYQWFAPVDMAELDELSARKRANRGWFIAYDRLHFGLDRPDTTGQSSKIDMTWGNRWDFGYMGEKDTGWLFSVLHVSGPNVYNDVRMPRTLQPDTDEERFDVNRPRIFFDPNFGDGTILERQSVNVATFSSFELNKTWRMEPYRYGGILEPMIGFRYFQINDYASNDDYQLIDDPLDADLLPDFEGFTRQITRTDNRLVTGQLGYRYYSTLRRMTFSQETRVFAGQNFQTQGFESRTYAFDIGGDTTDFLVPASVFGGRDNNETVVGLDARIEAAMQLTRAFNIRGGMQVLYIGRGIWRGANPGLGDQNLFSQSMISPSFTFGASFNR